LNETENRILLSVYQIRSQSDSTKLDQHATIEAREFDGSEQGC